MLKSDLAKRVAKDNGYPYDIANELVTATFKALRAMISEGYEVNIYGFGNFGFIHLPERDVINPTHGIIHAPASSMVTFRPNGPFKEAVHGIKKEQVDELNAASRAAQLKHVEHLNGNKNK